MKWLLMRIISKLKAIFGVVDWKDVLIRSLKTFAQAALAYVSTILATGSVVNGVGKTLWVSAVAAGISAAWNGVLSPVFKVINQKADEEFSVDGDGTADGK